MLATAPTSPETTLSSKPGSSCAPPLPHRAPVQRGHGLILSDPVARGQWDHALVPNPPQHQSSTASRFAVCASFLACQRKQMFLIYH